MASSIKSTAHEPTRYELANATSGERARRFASVYGLVILAAALLDFDSDRRRTAACAARPALRICIGAGFAQQEAVLILAEIIRTFRLSAAPGHTPELVNRLTLRPKNGIHLILNPRVAD